MRLRKQTDTGDMTFGQGQANFYVDEPALVGQSILTRLRLVAGQWFLDRLEGTPYASRILGKHSVDEASAALRQRVVTGPGVRSVENFTASRDADRRFKATGNVETVFGPVTIDQTL